MSAIVAIPAAISVTTTDPRYLHLHAGISSGNSGNVCISIDDGGGMSMSVMVPRETAERFARRLLTMLVARQEDILENRE